MSIQVNYKEPSENNFFLSGEIYSVAFSSNGRYIISGSNDDTIKIFDAEKKHQIHHIKDAHKGMKQTILLILPFN